MKPPTPKSLIATADEVRAYLAGKKSMFRVPVKPQPHEWPAKGPGVWSMTTGRNTWTTNERQARVEVVSTGEQQSTREYLMPLDEWLVGFSPYRVGTVIAVKEQWRINAGWDTTTAGGIFVDVEIKYEADGVVRGGPGIGLWGKLRSAVHMPVKASRLSLVVESVRCERVQAITEADAIAEGHHGNDNVGTGIGYSSNREAFACLWDAKHAKAGAGFDLDLWVWVYGVRVSKPEERTNV